MAKPFSEMTPIERHVNRWRLSEGLPASYIERDANMMGYDDAGIRRAMRLAVDEATTSLLAREKAAREVERDMPQLRQFIDEAKTAEEIYMAALKQLGGDRLDDIKDCDAKTLGAVYAATVNSLRTGNNDIVPQAQDESPRARLARSDLAAMSPNFGRIVVSRD